jgi:hypothetical protein
MSKCQQGYICLWGSWGRIPFLAFLPSKDLVGDHRLLLLSSKPVALHLSDPSSIILPPSDHSQGTPCTVKVLYD